MTGFFQSRWGLAIHMTHKTDKNETGKNRNQFQTWIMSH